MSQKEMLQSVYDDFSRRKCVEIHLIWSDGRKGGIGNPMAIEVAMKALLEELKKQMNNCY